MGYKRAGFHVLGNVELDKAMNDMYVSNHHPKYNYNMDLRDFNRLKNLPEELYRLDILDGSPPCSVFSTAGRREAGWGVEKKFREGQKEQRLDDLFFVFLETVRKLKPRVVIAENVIGLLGGNARGYVHEIIEGFHALDYEVQLFKLNAARMDVPQNRQRVFFIANNQGLPRLKLDFHRPLIPFGRVRMDHGEYSTKSETKYLRLMRFARPGDLNIGAISKRVLGKNSGFMNKIAADNRISPCITANGRFFRFYDRLYFSVGDFINVQTFPQDYDFCGNDVHYVCGMSVPPNMMAHIATQIWEQWGSQPPS